MSEMTWHLLLDDFGNDLKWKTDKITLATRVKYVFQGNFNHFEDDNLT